MTADPVENEKVSEAERLIQRTTGREARFTVRRVAGEEELRSLQQGLSATAAAAQPTHQSLTAIQADLMARVERPLKELWPEEQASLKDYELGFRPAGIALHARYQSEEALDAATHQVLRNALRARLSVDELDLILELLPPAPPKEGKQGAQEKIAGIEVQGPGS